MSDGVCNREVKRTVASPRTLLVYCLFFLSGVAALIYEASWSRQVGLAVEGPPVHVYGGVDGGGRWVLGLEASPAALRASAVAELTPSLDLGINPEP